MSGGEAARPRPAYPAWARGPGPWWRLSEPSTVVTDVLLAAVALVLAVRLAAATSGAGARLLAAAFVVVGASALAGAVVHGLTRQLGERRWRLLWRVTLLLAALVSALLLAGVAAAELRGPARVALLGAAVVKLAVVWLHTLRDADFRWIVLDSAGTLAAVAAVEGMAWVGRGAVGAQAAPWILGGVALSVLGGLVQQARLALHRHLNHNDLYHLAQAAAIYLFFRGALLLG
jgi:hypothetical protein